MRRLKHGCHNGSSGKTLSDFDLAFMLTPVRVFQKYKPRAREEGLNLSSAHSKLLKRDIAKHCPKGASQKYSLRTGNQSFDYAVEVETWGLY